MTRDNSIDIAKGIGIFLVVWGHQFSNCPIFNWIYLFHMPLFFFLGGCFIKDEKYSIFLYKKVRTLLTPFIIFYLGSLLLKIIIYKMREGNLNFMQDLDFYALSTINYPLWFIVCLFVSLNIYYFIRKIPYKFVIITIITAIGTIFFHYKINLPFFLTQALVAILFIYLGEKAYNNVKKNKYILITLMLTLPLYIYAGWNNVKTDMGGLLIDNNPLLFFMPAVSGISLTLLISRFINRYNISKTISQIGKYSLFIFAIHANTSFLMPISEGILRVIPIVNYNSPTCLGIINTFISILFSFILGIILKKYFPFFWGYKQNDKIISELKKQL